jgi:hypothetical protein
MKIVSWNCNGAFRKKYHFLDSLEADILVVQECEDPSRSDGDYRSWAQNHLWHGKTKNKGIGIFAKAGIHLEKIEWPDDGLELFLPCRIDNSVFKAYECVGLACKVISRGKLAAEGGKELAKADEVDYIAGPANAPAHQASAILKGLTMPKAAQRIEVVPS